MRIVAKCREGPKPPLLLHSGNITLYPQSSWTSRHIYMHFSLLDLPFSPPLHLPVHPSAPHYPPPVASFYRGLPFNAPKKPRLINRYEDGFEAERVTASCARFVRGECLAVPPLMWLPKGSFADIKVGGGK